MKNKPLIYLAGPYTKPCPVQNTSIAIRVADDFARRGIYCFVPHLCFAWDMIRPREYEFWMNYTLQFLKRCDALYRLSGESSGAEREIIVAKELGIPVFRNREHLYEWIHEQSEQEIKT